MRLLYFDCFAGAAGDMLLGALIDAGASERAVRDALGSLHLEGWELDISTVTKQGLRATKATVRADTARQTPRRYDDIVGLIERSSLPSAVRERALRCFALLGRAEAKVHGVELGDVHFHEVGGVDAIIDIVGTCAALESFMPARVWCSALPVGAGAVPTAHGRLPVPAPAVVELLAARGVPTVGRGQTEVLTPTGAALLCALADGFGRQPAMRLLACGYGAGDREQDLPNVVRVLVGEQTPDAGPAMLVVETNLDDMSPELIPDVIAALLAAGAADTWVTPVVMKKGRPGLVLSVLCATGERKAVEDVLFRHTTTFGLRITEVEREVLARRWVEVDVDGQMVRVKLGLRGDEIVTMAPEHDDAAAAAAASGMPLKVVYQRALDLARRSLAQSDPRP